MVPILTAKNIQAGYQDRPILQGVDLQVAKGERLLLIGPNGCGKTTLLKALSGNLKLKKGQIIFKNKTVTNEACNNRVRMGLGYLMQTNNIFPSLTVKENLHLSIGLWKGEFYDRLERTLSIFPILKSKLKHYAGLLSGGERQALAISMVLMRPADLLLLDEPTAGLSPKAAVSILDCIHKAQNMIGFATLTVEHNIPLIYPLIERVLIMNQGVIVAEENDTNGIFDHKRLQRYYLG